MLKSFVKKFAADESGASLIEYSLLIGLITVLAVVAITAVGIWVNGQWTNLQATIGA
jgi:pilus assembly protein Flp/PilA